MFLVSRLLLTQFLNPKLDSRLTEIGKKKFYFRRSPIIVGGKFLERMLPSAGNRCLFVCLVHVKTFHSQDASRYFQLERQRSTVRVIHPYKFDHKTI